MYLDVSSDHLYHKCVGIMMKQVITCHAVSVLSVWHSSVHCLRKKKCWKLPGQLTYGFKSFYSKLNNCTQNCIVTLSIVNMRVINFFDNVAPIFAKCYTNNQKCLKCFLTLWFLCFLWIKKTTDLHVLNNLNWIMMYIHKTFISKWVQIWGYIHVCFALLDKCH